jgi:hypothetical protein
VSGIVYRCDHAVYWFGDGLWTQCVRPGGHKGLHRDGLYWFDDDGIRQPRDQPPERCRGYVVDGEPVVVRGEQPLTEKDIAALTEVARAARSLITPEIAERQAAARTRHHDRLVRLGIRS